MRSGAGGEGSQPFLRPLEESPCVGAALREECLDVLPLDVGMLMGEDVPESRHVGEARRELRLDQAQRTEFFEDASVALGHLRLRLRQDYLADIGEGVHDVLNHAFNIPPGDPVGGVARKIEAGEGLEIGEFRPGELDSPDYRVPRRPFHAHPPTGG